MLIKKKLWKKPRNVLLSLKGVIVPVGNSARFHPAIPYEYIGKKAILTIIDDDEEEFEIIQRD